MSNSLQTSLHGRSEFSSDRLSGDDQNGAAEQPISDRGTAPSVVPTFSVCIVVRDRPVMLVKAVRSVLANDFQNFELVIVDDGSQIPVTQVMDEAELSADQRLRVVCQPPKGIAPARNAALRACSGRFITVLDSDDEFFPDALARLNQLLTTTGASWVYTDYEEAVNGAVRTIRLPEYTSARSMLMAVLTRPRLPFKHSGTTIERELLERIGGYDESFGLFEDVELVLRALKAGVQPRHLAHPVVRFHRHSGNSSRGRFKGLKYWFRMIDMYRPSSLPGVALGIKILRLMSETGKWVVSHGH